MNFSYDFAWQNRNGAQLRLFFVTPHCVRGSDSYYGELPDWAIERWAHYAALRLSASSTLLR